MTVTIPENGFRARVACGAVVFAMALGASVATAPAATAAQKSTDEPPVLVVSAGANGVVVPGQAMTASVTVQNGADTTLDAGRVRVELNRTALTGADAVASWLDDGEAQGGFALIGDGTTAKVDAGSSVTTALPVAQETLTDLAPGVYPIRAVLTGTDTTAGDDADASSVLVISAEPHPQVTVFVPITATPADGVLLSSDELSELTAADGDLTAQLDGVTGTSAVLAIDPAIVAAIRVLGSSAPSTATQWLDRLESLPNERFALQFGDADATTQAQADLSGLLAPTTLAPFLDEADFTSPPPATGLPTPTGTPSPAPTDGPALPDDQMLTAIDGATPGILWPRTDVTTDDLADFSTYLGGTATTLLSSTTVGGVLDGHATVGASDVVVTNAAASDALSDAAGEADADVRAQSLATANAYLFLASQGSTAPLAVGLDRDENRTSAALRAAVATADSPGVDLTSLRASAAAAASITTEVSDDRGSALHLLLDDEQTLDRFSSILDDSQVLLSPERIRIMRTIATGLGAEKFATAVDDHRQATRDTLDAVGIPPSSTIQLLSANADLPFAVRNDLPWPVNVVLTVLPSDPRLDVDSVTRATIQAGTTSRVKVPVTARVGSGELDLRLSLASPTGVALGDQQTVRVSVRAEWEGIGLAIFGSLIAVLLVLGVIRTVRRRRRGTDAEDEADADTEESVEDAPEESQEEVIEESK